MVALMIESMNRWRITTKQSLVMISDKTQDYSRILATAKSFYQSIDVPFTSGQEQSRRKGRLGRQLNDGSVHQEH